MNNTVLLTGKGMWAFMLLLKLNEFFPGSSLREPKLKWWQTTARYELRLQNLTRQEISELHSINDRPLTTYIKIEVF